MNNGRKAPTLLRVHDRMKLLQLQRISSKQSSLPWPNKYFSE